MNFRFQKKRIVSILFYDKCRIKLVFATDVVYICNIRLLDIGFSKTVENFQ